jgi:hypothetical protein
MYLPWQKAPMHSRKLVALLSLVALALSSMGAATHAQQQNAEKADEIVARAVQYVARFVARFSRVVAEEVYVQERAEGAAVTHSRRARRELTSDFLFVRPSNRADWLVLRDVRLVDGREVRDSESRLVELLTAPADETRAFVARFVAENSRHSLEGWPVINDPLIALSLLQDEYRHRFAFSLEGSSAEREMAVIRFREQARPTLLRTRQGDVVLQGRFWIARQTGQISQTELAMGRNATITTTFAYDEALQMHVPQEMRELYPTLFATGRARYSNFRTFQIQTDEILDKTSLSDRSEEK